VNVAVALGASGATARMRRGGADAGAGRGGAALRVLTGVVFIGLGVRLALLRTR